jgi:hypothetical protein
VGTDPEIVVDGSYAYVAYYNWPDSFRIFSVEDPSNPIMVSEMNVGYARAIDVAGSYAYVSLDDGLGVISVEDPTSPVYAGFCDTNGNTGVFIDGPYAYVIDFQGGFRIILITDPANPVEAGFYDSPGGENDIFVRDGIAYLACGYPSPGVRVISVKDPSNPEEIGFYGTQGDAWSVTVDSSYVFLSIEGEGLLILEFYGETGIGGDDPGGGLPKSFSLSQNYPNPFNPSTTIEFDVPESGKAGARVRLDIFDIRGKLVRTLVDGMKSPGRHRAQWDGRDSQQRRIASGVYLCRFAAGDFESTRKLLLLE